MFKKLKKFTEKIVFTLKNDIFYNLNFIYKYLKDIIYIFNYIR